MDFLLASQYKLNLCVRKRMSFAELAFFVFLAKLIFLVNNFCFKIRVGKLFFTASEPPIKTNPPGQGPRPFHSLWFCSIFSHRTMHRCLSVVWQVGACFRLPDSRDWSTPGRSPGRPHPRESPHPWATPGRPHPRESTPLGHSWATTS